MLASKNTGYLFIYFKKIKIFGVLSLGVAGESGSGGVELHGRGWFERPLLCSDLLQLADEFRSEVIQFLNAHCVSCSLGK